MLILTLACAPPVEENPPSASTELTTKCMDKDGDGVRAANDSDHSEPQSAESQRRGDVFQEV